MSTPKIYSKNYLTPESILTVSSGAGSKAKLFDRDRDSRWTSQGQGADGNGALIDVDFYEGVNPLPRTLDTFFLINTNVKNLNFYFWNGSSFVLHYSMTGNGNAHLVQGIPSVTTSRVRFELLDTFPANQEKFIGELGATALLLDPEVGPDQYDVKYREKTKDLLLGDGSLHRVLVLHSPNRTQKYEARVGFRYAGQALYDQFLSLKESGVPFLWYPEPADRPQDLFFVHWSGPWKAKYVSSYKGAGFDLDLELKEV